MRPRTWLLVTIGLLATLVVVLVSYAPYFSASRMGELGSRYTTLVHDYAEADIQTLRGESEVAEATNLGILASDLKAEVSDLTAPNGDPLRTSPVLGIAQAVIEDAQPVNERLGEHTTLSEHAKAIYSMGLEHMALGVLDTLKIREPAAAFLSRWQAHMAVAIPPHGPVSRLVRAWRADTPDPSESDDAAYMKPLADIAQHNDEHLRRLLACMHRAVDFAYGHDVPVPEDAVEALKEARAIAATGPHPTHR